MTASRDAEFKAMQNQRKTMANPAARGQGSIDAAAKASHGGGVPGN